MHRVKSIPILTLAACVLGIGPTSLGDTGIGDGDATNGTDDPTLGVVQLLGGAVQIGCTAIWPGGADRSYETYDVASGFASGGAGSPGGRYPVDVKGFFTFNASDESLTLSAFASAHDDCERGACDAFISIASVGPLVFNVSEPRYALIDAPRSARGVTCRLRSLDGLIEPGLRGEPTVLQPGAYFLSFEVTAQDADASLEFAIHFSRIPTADISDDGRVDDADVALLLSSWGLQECGHPCDLVPDCEIDGQDLAVLLGQWTVQRGG